ncbi:MAG: oligosaccharide flippase family protein [Candidatus Omnitrophica bacterium]|nr:oligosaccharide flippase family protein [Candidatus Omnitrophota bacterium]
MKSDHEPRLRRNQRQRFQPAMIESKKKSIITDTAAYAAANYVAQGIGIVNSILLRRFMGPVSMGIWSLLQVILGYCGYASFGTTKAMARDYPFLRGKGQHAEAERLKDMILTFSILMSVLPAAGLLGYLAVRGDALDPLFRFGLVFIAVFLFVQRFYDLVMILLRSDKRFMALSQLIVINAVGILVVTALLVHRWNIYGLFFGTALVTFICLVFVYKVNPYRFKFYWNTQELVRELKLGVPLIATSFLVSFLKSMDKLIIAKRLGFYDLGLYSVAMMAQSYLLSFPMMFAHVWYPNLQEAYGEREDAKAVKNYLLTPVLILSVLVPFLAGVVIFALPVVVELFIPNFVPGLPAMKVYLISIFFILLAQFSSCFLVTLDKYLIQIPAVLASIVLNAVLNLTFVKMGWGLLGIAWGTTLSFVFYGAAMYVLSLKFVGHWRETMASLGQSMTLLVLLALATFLIDHWVRYPSLFVAALLKLSIFLILACPCFLYLEKETRLFVNLRDAFFKKSQPLSGWKVSETGVDHETQDPA